MDHCPRQVTSHRSGRRIYSFGFFVHTPIGERKVKRSGPAFNPDTRPDCSCPEQSQSSPDRRSSRQKCCRLHTLLKALPDPTEILRIRAPSQRGGLFDSTIFTFIVEPSTKLIRSSEAFGTTKNIFLIGPLTASEKSKRARTERVLPEIPAFQERRPVRDKKSS